MNARTSFALVTVATLLSPVALAASLYRYTNDEGVTVHDVVSREQSQNDVGSL